MARRKSRTLTEVELEFMQVVWKAGEAATGDVQNALRKQGRRPVVVCPPRQRTALRRMLASPVPDLAVLGYNEIDSVEVHSVRTVGIES